MSTTGNPTPQAIKKAYIEQLGKRYPNPEERVAFAENELLAFIQKHVDACFTGIYEETQPAFYRQVRDSIAHNKDMSNEDEANNFLYSVSLKSYAEFLSSKDFRQLSTPPKHTKQPGAKKKIPKHAAKEREMTEGEKKHVEYETRHRNPALRQACIDKYGYQCQCCGMNFAELYGKELGENFIEVHHLKMLSTYDECHPEDYVENLVPLCSNCHSMIHHGKNGPLTLGELRAAYKGEKKKLKIWKED